MSPMIANENSVELLAPAGTPEKLEIALHYGADAVYLAGRDFSLRNFSANFSLADMRAARRLTRENGVTNVCGREHLLTKQRSLGHNRLPGLPGNRRTGRPDRGRSGDIHAGPELLPHVPIHVSTQANTTNTGTARFWRDLGATRVNAARELTLDELREMSAESGIEVEAFVHGAMCIAYSGRCLLSGYMKKRESNRGMCCQPCRFHYTLMEQSRPGQYFPIAEDPRGAYVFNSRDLCMIEHLPALIDAGIRSLKIEGRMKSIHYLAGVVKVYREAIDAWYRDPVAYQVQQRWLTELSAISHRGYCTGFYFNDPDQTAANLDDVIYPGYTFVAKVLTDGPGRRRPGAGEKQNRCRRCGGCALPRRSHPARHDSTHPG
jgi:putative protease